MKIKARSVYVRTRLLKILSADASMEEMAQLRKPAFMDVPKGKAYQKPFLNKLLVMGFSAPVSRSLLLCFPCSLGLLRPPLCLRVLVV